MAKNITELLMGLSQDKYGDNFNDHLLKIYDLYLSSAFNTTELRQKANSFYLGINSAIVGLIGYLNFYIQYIQITIRNISANSYLWNCYLLLMV